MSDSNEGSDLPVIPGLADLTVLARGGFATVYRARQVSANRDVAVKVENGTLDSERRREQFKREADAASQMSSHPHVVDLFDVGVTSAGHPYLIMELCESTYADRMKASALPVTEARDVGTKIADALADAHALGLVHRDVKPANILVTRFGEPVLADFGLTVLVESRFASITLDLTPAYAAPELFNQGPPAPATDVYGLSATIYALILGRPPRWGNKRVPTMATLVDMFAEPIPDLPGAPADLMALLRQGMDNDPARRPTAASLRDRLAGRAPAADREADPTLMMTLPPVPRTSDDDPTVRTF